jgi:NADPH:quinone reductase-like Zn-dependent oxidoreductase
MKAAVVDALGRAPVYTDFNEPVPRDGAVVVTVEASALTNLTRGLVSGNHHASREIQLPAVAGVDGVGRLADGRRVYTGALAPFGMMAERALINPDAATPLPDTIDPVTAAAIPNPGLSAWMSLDYAAAVRPGAHVLVLGATGVTGLVAVQLAKSCSARSAWSRRAETSSGCSGYAPSAPTTSSHSARTTWAPGSPPRVPSSSSTPSSTTCGESQPRRC